MAKEQLNENLSNWLKQVAEKKNLPIEYAAKYLGLDEYINRLACYPKVQMTLNALSFDYDKFEKEVRKCWVMFGQYDIMRFSAMMDKKEQASQAILDLIKSFPDDKEDIAKRIDIFLNRAIELGFSTPDDHPDKSGAASFASVILTALDPAKFVDYRRNRWKELAEILNYPYPAPGGSYGEWMFWAGQFATNISETNTFIDQQRLKPERFPYPLWMVAGICRGRLYMLSDNPRI